MSCVGDCDLDWVNNILRWCVDAVTTFPGGAHPLVSLTVVSAVVGLSLLWVFKRISDQDQIMAQKKLVQAHLLELRLYGDDPRLIWKSQIALMLANLRYMKLMLRPAIFLTLPIVFFLIHLDAFYGSMPLPIGKSAVLTVQANGAITPDTPVPRIHTPPEIFVETPAIRSIKTAQFSWRIRPEKMASGKLHFFWKDKGSWEKSFSAGDQQKLLSVRRVSTWYETIWNPGEDRMDVDSVAWVEISYTSATIGFAGVDLHWLVWFLLLSIVPAYFLKGYFGVAI